MKKSIAIIGEGKTEWFYFDSLRVASRYPFRLAPDFPAHSDIDHLLKFRKFLTWFNGCFPWIEYLVSFRIVLTSPMNKW